MEHEAWCKCSRKISHKLKTKEVVSHVGQQRYMAGLSKSCWSYSVVDDLVLAAPNPDANRLELQGKSK